MSEQQQTDYRVLTNRHSRTFDAHGTPTGRFNRVACGFSDLEFQQINDLRREIGIGFAPMVRLLVQKALADKAAAISKATGEHQ